VFVVDEMVRHFIDY